MKKTTLLLSLLLLISLCLTACGASSGADMAAEAPAAEPMEAMTETAMDDYGWNGATEEAYAEDAVEVQAAGATVADSENANYEASLKIIKTGSLSIESETFDQTDSYIRQTVDSYGGILAERSVNGTNGSRWATYTVRIPAKDFDNFFYDVAGACTVVSQSISSEDVTEQYTDLSTRLETARKKYERLLDLMDQAETLTDLYQLETEIASVEYEIDSLTGILNGLSSRVSYSTVYLDLSELSRVTAMPEQPSFTAALGAAFGQGLSNAIDGIQSLLISLAYHWFGLLMFFIILAVVILIVVSRARRKTKKEQTEVPLPDPPKED